MITISICSSQHPGVNIRLRYPQMKHRQRNLQFPQQVAMAIHIWYLGDFIHLPFFATSTAPPMSDVSTFFSFSGPHFEDSFSPRRGSFSSVDYHKSLPPQPPTPPALSPLGSDVPSGILTLVHIRPVTMGLTPQRDPFARLNIFQIELTDHETNHNNMLGPLSWVFRNWLILACSCSVFPDLCPIHN